MSTTFSRDNNVNPFLQNQSNGDRPTNKYVSNNLNPKLTMYVSKVSTLFSLFRTVYNIFYTELYIKLKVLVYKSFSFSWYYINGFVFILFIDACLTDDEPL